MANPLKGFMHPGPDGPRMTEGQLCIVTHGATEAIGRAQRGPAPTDPAPLRAALGALDAYPADRSCWACRHSLPFVDPRDPSEARLKCGKHQKPIPSDQMEGGNIGCPDFADPAIEWVNADSEPRL